MMRRKKELEQEAFKVGRHSKREYEGGMRNRIL